jgi:dihydrofolate synthase/folylpolyglutamate synthase
LTQLTAASPLADWLAHLEGLHPKGQGGIELGLARIARVQAALGQTKFCPILTVAGTNGKGSVCAYLANVLDRAGFKVGLYTSPHLIRYNERVRLNGEAASDAALAAAFAKVEAARQTAGEDDGPVALTYFEFGTLAAWEVFAAAGVEALVLEVGLGGRLDAVNIYEPDVAIVTGIALDHTDWLGPDREAIGFEKAGIFRAGKPAIVGDPKPPQSLLDHAAAIGAETQLLGRDFGYERSTEERQQWRYWGRVGGDIVKRGGLAHPGLRGPIQVRNAAVALAALDAVREQLPVTMGAIRRGLIETELPGRFQVVPGQPAVVLDVAHNPEAAAVLVDNLSTMGFFPATYAVLGMLADKDIVTTLAPFREKVTAWYLCDLDVPRGAKAEELAELLRAAGGNPEIHCFPDPETAFAAAAARAGESDRIAAFGSFYTVSGALRALKRDHV